MTLTEKQQRMYHYLRDFIQARGVAPSYDEIRHHFGFQSFQSVQKHLDQLEKKGYIQRTGKHLSRAIRLVEHGGRSVMLRLAGTVAAGNPIEPIEGQETVDVPEAMLGSGEYFALKVKGSSMIDEGIHDGDTIVVRRQATAENGQTVVALVEGEATVKKYYVRGKGVELRPANPTMQPMLIQNGTFEIRGVVVGLMRQYGL
ncbi:transcriptional repressor LexA [candidate division KSB1 bacterium]|nr:transcriptional repressor LexA [candidate division KSB1 bacterium]